MSVPRELLSQCLEITKQLIALNQKAAINIRIGNEFEFSFNNQEIGERKKSPSQVKRNLERNAICLEVAKKILFIKSTRQSLDLDHVCPDEGLKTETLI